MENFELLIVLIGSALPLIQSFINRFYKFGGVSQNVIAVAIAISFGTIYTFYGDSIQVQEVIKNIIAIYSISQVFYLKLMRGSISNLIEGTEQEV